MSTRSTSPASGTVTPLVDVSADTRESMLDAVREANGRRARRPAETVEGAVADVEAFLVVPEWSEGEPAAVVASDALRELYGLDAADAPLVWALYAEGARRLGFSGAVPTPSLTRAQA